MHVFVVKQACTMCILICNMESLDDVLAIELSALQARYEEIEVAEN